MDKIFYSELDSPIGTIWAARSKKGLVRLNLPCSEGKFLNDLNSHVEVEPIYKPSQLDDLNIWLRNYFKGNNSRYRKTLYLIGTEFQKKVWKAILEIPYGKLTSYGLLANSINTPKASRAVGNAVGQNPISILIPCHRVIRSNGNLGGFGGGLERKRYLLNLEGILPSFEEGIEKKVDLREYF